MDRSSKMKVAVGTPAHFGTCKKTKAGMCIERSRKIVVMFSVSPDVHGECFAPLLFRSEKGCVFVPTFSTELCLLVCGAG